MSGVGQAWVKTAQLHPHQLSVWTPPPASQQKSLIMNKTTNSNIYYSPNHDLRMNDCLTMSLVSSPLDLNNIIILNTISKGDASQHGPLCDTKHVASALCAPVFSCVKWG